jgi:hypothetical protein
MRHGALVAVRFGVEVKLLVQRGTDREQRGKQNNRDQQTSQH